MKDEKRKFLIGHETIEDSETNEDSENVTGFLKLLTSSPLKPGSVKFQFFSARLCNKVMKVGLYSLETLKHEKHKTIITKFSRQDRPR